MLNSRLIRSLLLAIYLLTLIPVSSVVICDETTELREAIHSLQTLQTGVVAGPTDVHQSLRNSIKSMQTLAGLQSFIVKKQHNSTDSPYVLIAFKLRTPHLLQNVSEPLYPLPIGIQESIELNNKYTSILLSPETPPPNIS